MADCRHYCLFLLLILLLLFTFMKMKNFYNIFLFSLPPTFTCNIELVNPKIMKFVFVASPLSTQHWRMRLKTGGPWIRIMRPTRTWVLFDLVSLLIQSAWPGIRLHSFWTFVPIFCISIWISLINLTYNLL
jgi:hypothetical protein